MKRQCFTIALITLSLSLFGPQAAQAEEEPAPGVARISLIHGDVSTMRGDSGDWVATTVNAPIVRGDKVSTGTRSRAELQLDYANVLRLDQRTDVKIADLMRTRIQVQISQGLLNFTVLKGTEADVEIDTPNVAVHPLGEGSYRVQVNSNSETEVTVRKGEAEVSTPQGSTTVEKNQLVTIRGADHPEYQIAKAARRDEWDEWNRDRDSEMREAQSWRHANRYYTGAHDLDGYGHWVNVPGYDWCWTPYVDAGWVPYRDGRWVWEPYYGWTWVSYEPWGWAPYHYGRWFYGSGSWLWWPGFVTAGFVPVWSPAWVSFLGFGFGRHAFNFGFGFGFSSIGWCPLGPFDPFFPWWGFGSSFNVVNVTNITNITNITNVTNIPGVGNGVHGRNAGNRGHGPNLHTALNNPQVRRAITTVSVEDFVRGRVPRNPLPVDVATLRQAKVVQGTVPAVPTRESLRPVDRPVNHASLPARANNAESFFTRRTPPGGQQPFAERAAEIQKMMLRPNPLEAGNHGTAAQGYANVRGNLPTTNPALNSERETARPAGVGTQPQREIPVGNQPINLSEWKKLGHSSTDSVPRTILGGAPGAQGGPAQNSSAGTRPKTQIQPAQQPPSPGWQRFGTGSPRDRGPAPLNILGGTPRETGSPANRSDWQGFSNAPRVGGPAPTVSVPREARVGAAAPSPTVGSRPAPSTQGEDPAAAGGWRQFNHEPRPATVERRSSSPAPRHEGWLDSPSRSEPRSPWRSPAPVYREAPRNYERPPLEIRKPIVTERSTPSPRSYEGGGSRGGGWSGANRGGGWGGGGGRSVPPATGGGRSAPSSSSSHQGNQHGKH